MSFLAPGALIWLGSIPVLIWLWRLASTRRQVHIPSLIPFEHLLKRAPKRRTRLVVTLLFWLQLAALLGLVAALARPVLFRPRAKTVLAVLDTSASMGAVRRGARAFDQAKRALLARIARKATADQWLVMTTAPAAPLTPQPTGDAAELARAVEGLHARHLGGSLSTAAHIGRMLLGADPDEIVVVTDEARPAETPGDRLHWITVGAAAPNAAIVGLDEQGPLCSVAEASVAATVQNFSDEPAEVMLAASQGGRRLAETRAPFAPRERRSLALTVPEGTEGWVEISLAAKGDALDADNRAWVNVSRGADVPIAVRSDTASFRETLSAWLGACEALAWTLDAPPDAPAPPPASLVWGRALVITDREERVGRAAVASMVFAPPASGQAALRHWVVSGSHPIGSYLAPVEVVSARLNTSPGVETSGAVVVTALVGGRQVPVVVADERDGRRTVAMRLDPSESRESTPVLLAFFNSLRWLMGRSAAGTMGEPMLLGGFAAGRVSVRRPDGSTERLEADGGALVYEAPALAGLYRFSQGAAEETAAVNFFDPLESNLLARASTWRGTSNLSSLPERAAAGRAAHPLSRLLMGLVFAVLLVEWWRYTEKRDHFPFPALVRQEKGSGPTTLAAGP